MRLDQIRKKIDEIDDAILMLLAQRQELSILAAKEKIREGKHIRDQHRETSLMKERIEEGTARGLSEKFVHDLFSLIIASSLRVQEEEV